MSGGQQQRVALARALAIEPQVLLLDEPLSALDAKIRIVLRKEIRAIQRQLGITTVYVTHDQEEALSLSDRVVVMSDGRIEQIGTPSEIYNFPSTAFVASFVGTLNLVNAGVIDAATGRLSIDGQEIRTSKAIDGRRADGRVTLAVRPEGISLGEGEPGSNRLRGTVEDINFLGSIVRIRFHLGEGNDGEPPTVIALDTFNEPHLKVPDVGQAVTVSFPPEACFVLGAARDGPARPRRRSARRCDRPARRHRPRRLRQGRHDHRVRADVERLGGRAGRGPRAGHGTAVDGPLFAMLGYDPGDADRPARRRAGRDADGTAARADPRRAGRGGRSRTPEADGRSRRPGTRRIRSRSPGPLTDLAGPVRPTPRRRRRMAVATSDDRDPTERTLAALGVADAVEAMVCADDGIPVKPAPDMVLHLCATLGVEPGRTAVVGDSTADLRMGRAAGRRPRRRRAHRRRWPRRPRAAGRRRHRLGRGLRSDGVATTPGIAVRPWRGCRLRFS